VGVSFTAEVELDSPTFAHKDLDIVVSVGRKDGGAARGAGVLQKLTTERRANESGQLLVYTLQLKFPEENEVDLCKGELVLHFDAMELLPDGGRNLALAATHTVRCARHRLVCLSNDGGGSTSSTSTCASTSSSQRNDRPIVWYKDEGGKDNCMEVRLQLRDAEDRLVTTRDVPLLVKLVYEGGAEVEKQNILSFSPQNSRVFIDDTGTGCIFFRINEVSNRHMGKHFQLHVRPDTDRVDIDPSLFDVSAVYSRPIDVKSKSVRSNSWKQQQLLQQLQQNSKVTGKIDAAAAAMAAEAGPEFRMGSNGSENTPLATLAVAAAATAPATTTATATTADSAPAKRQRCKQQ
jgi:hypothetical protein